MTLEVRPWQTNRRRGEEFRLEGPTGVKKGRGWEVCLMQHWRKHVWLEPTVQLPRRSQVGWEEAECWWAMILGDSRSWVIKTLCALVWFGFNNSRRPSKGFQPGCDQTKFAWSFWLLCGEWIRGEKLEECREIRRRMLRVPDSSWLTN